MGLLIIAYNRVTPYAELDEDAKGNLSDDDYLEIKNPDGFKIQLSPLDPGRYLATEAARESIGGYQYYAAWRAWLKEIYGEGGNFSDLIDFSDCEGFLGPYSVRSVCGDLEAREEELEAAAERTVSDPETRDGYTQTYYQFLRIFKEAGYDGVVQFT